MRKIFCCALALAMLGLAGCGRAEKPVVEETTTTAQSIEAMTEQTIEQTAEQTTEQPTFAWETRANSLPVVDIPESYGATAAYAKTPERVYAVNFHSYDDNGEREYYLYTATLGNLGKTEQIDLPREYKGKQLSPMKICGISPQGLYVYFFSASNRVGVVYLVPHDGGKAKIIMAGGGFLCPWYNAAGHSLLYFRAGRLEALRLDTNECTLVIECTYPDTFSDIWHNLKDGSTALERCGSEEFQGGACLQIDADNKAHEQSYGFDELHHTWVKQPASATEEDLYARDDVLTFATCGGWIYCVEGDYGARNLYRVKSDGSQKKLLKEKTRIYQLETANDQLFALASYDPKDEDFEVDRIMLHRLDAEGRAVETIYRGHSGDNGSMAMRRWGSLILVSEFMIGGGHGEWFAAFYDPATGALFTAEGGPS